MVSASSFGLSGSSRAAYGRRLVVGRRRLVRILVAAAVLIPWRVVQLRGRWSPAAPQPPAHGRLRPAVAVAGCQLAYFNAVEHVPVGVALLIEYTAPVAVVGWLWLRRGNGPPG